MNIENKSDLRGDENSFKSFNSDVENNLTYDIS